MEEAAAKAEEALDRPPEEALSRTEALIEQEKLKLERERILLERERLDAARDRLRLETALRAGRDGQPTVAVTTLALVAIICMLLGGMLGSFSTGIRRDRRSAARLQEVMQTLASAAPETSATNDADIAANELPAWLKTMTPTRAHGGISLVVIQ